MSKPLTILALGGGISLAAIGFVAAFLWVESPSPDDEAAQGIVTLAEDLPDDQPRPTPVSASDLTTLDSGLQYVDFEVGTGEQPVDGQMVEVHYTGWLKDGGKMFDSSVHNNRPPIEFQLGRPGIIKGWQLGLRDMRVGGKRQLVIPPDLAYGERGRPGIPPNSTLIFDVELVGLGEIRARPDHPEVDFDGNADVMELDQGVKAIDLEEGEGTEVQERSVVEMELTIWNADKELFFSSMDRPRAASFLVGGNRAEKPPLDGLDIGVRGMREGGVRYLELPPEVAFGERGQPPVIDPNATIYALITANEVSEPRNPPTALVDFDRAALTETESGLKYIEIEPGDGDKPAEGDTVFAEYSGWLEDGTLFDSSYKRKNAFSFALGRGGVIPAWEETLADMRVGGKRIIVAPPDLAYGDRGQGQIPAGATLIFEIELVDIQRAE